MATIELILPVALKAFAESEAEVAGESLNMWLVKLIESKHPQPKPIKDDRKWMQESIEKRLNGIA